MAGIYIHIPFCKQACHYCDFHFSTNLKTQAAMVNAIVEEIRLSKDYLQEATISTIYFGGGTPSILTVAELRIILESIKSCYVLEPDTEITLEANPDDLSVEKLEALRASGINRLSIGIQTFHEGALQFLNRAHNQAQAFECVTHAQRIGFDNISIDLIYGIPSEDHKNWIADLNFATSMGVQHISSYCLTIEEQTVLGKWKKQGKLKVATDAYEAEQFELLADYLSNKGFEQYEISNFAQSGFESRHNSNYWKGIHYVGIGPGAHSFNGTSRRWNIRNNHRYISDINLQQIPFELEELTPKDLANEYLMTSIRTKWGMDLERLEQVYNFDKNQMNTVLKNYEQQGLIRQEKSTVYLTQAGKLLGDEITLELFI